LFEAQVYRSNNKDAIGNYLNILNWTSDKIMEAVAGVITPSKYLYTALMEE